MSPVFTWFYSTRYIFQGVIAVGLFADNPIPLDTTNGRSGLFKGGDWYLLAIQTLSAFCLTSWGIGSTLLLLYFVNKIVPIRMDANEELLGADLMEHRIRHSQIGLSRAISALAPIKIDLNKIAGIQPIGLNPGHEKSLAQLRAADDKLQQWQIYLNQTERRSGLRRKSLGTIFRRNSKTVHITERIGTNSFKDSYKGKNNDSSTSTPSRFTEPDSSFVWLD